jgi:hypothetical protein
MANATEHLITVLWRLEGFKGIKGEISQGHSIDELGAATDTDRMGRLQNLPASLQCWAPQRLRRSTIT